MIPVGSAPSSFRSPSANLDKSDREYLREEQRSQTGCSAGRMQSDFHHGLLGLENGRGLGSREKGDQRLSGLGILCRPRNTSHPGSRSRPTRRCRVVAHRIKTSLRPGMSLLCQALSTSASGTVSVSMRSLPPADSAQTFGKASKIAVWGMLPPPLPYISIPELRNAAAEREILGPAISPISIRRIPEDSAITSWPVRASRLH